MGTSIHLQRTNHAILINFIRISRLPWLDQPKFLWLTQLQRTSRSKFCPIGSRDVIIGQKCQRTEDIQVILGLIEQTKSILEEHLFQCLQNIVIIPNEIIIPLLLQIDNHPRHLPSKLPLSPRQHHPLIHLHLQHKKQKINLSRIVTRSSRSVDQPRHGHHLHIISETRCRVHS